MCISRQGQDLYSHQKLNMYIYWFSSESGYRRRRRRRRRRQRRTRHIANDSFTDVKQLDTRVLQKCSIAQRFLNQTQCSALHDAVADEVFGLREAAVVTWLRCPVARDRAYNQKHRCIETRPVTCNTYTSTHCVIVKSTIRFEIFTFILLAYLCPAYSRGRGGALTL